MNRRAYTITIIFLLILKMAVYASSFEEKVETQSTFPPATANVHFNMLNSENGLSNNFLTAVAQDKMGYIWFGSRNGLNRFDGTKITVYVNESNNPKSIGNNYAWYLLVDRAGTLWVATWGGGLSRYDPISDSFTRYQHDQNDPGSLGSDLVWYVYEDRNGTIWVATDGGGLNRLDSKTGKFKHYQHDPKDPTSISHMTVTQIVEDSSGSLWVGTYGGGLNKFEPETGTFKRYQHDDAAPGSLSNNNIWSLCMDSRQRLWIGTEGGLDLYTPETGTFIHYKNRKNDPQSISHNTVLTIHEDRSGYLWIGTFGGGLNKFDPERGIFTRYMHHPFDETSLCDDTVYHIYEDRAGSMWIATENGISRVDPGSERFTHFKRIPGDPDSLSSNQVSAFHEDKEGIIWMGTKGGGVNRFDSRKNSFRHYQHQTGMPDTLSSNSVTAIAAAPENTLWVATEGGGLNRFDPQTGTSVHYRHIPDNPNSLGNDTIWDLSVDRQGQLWIVMDGGGLNRFDPEKQKFTQWRSTPNNPNSLVSDWALSVFADSRGIIWIGTDTGLSRFDPERNAFQNYLSRQNTVGQSENNSIYCIFEDKRGTIWIGTNYGLKRIDEANGHIAVYRERDGLAGNYVADIVEDHLGFLWISTSKGLSRFDPETATFRNYDKQDGLQSNFFLWGSGLRSRSNELYFGGINGFNRFNPEKLPDNSFIPPVVLTDFQLFNKSVVIGTPFMPQQISSLDHITLTHGQSVFSLEFAALNFRSPEKNRYAYMLEGFDSEWNHVGSERRYATYTNLDPGTYTFHVKASNNDGVWNQKGASLKIVVQPPWWATLWFRIFTGLVFLFCILGVFKYINRLRFEIKERQRGVAALRQSEHNFRTTFDSSGDAIFIHNMKGIFIEVNEVACERLGYDRDELLKLNPMDIDTVESAKLISERMAKIKENNQVVYEVIHRRKNGTTFPVEINSKVIEYQGKQCIISVARDITEQKRISARLQQAQKIESIGTLAGGIAHDFNNILFPIIGYTEMLIEDISEDSSFQPGLKQIHKGAMRASELVKQILTFSRQESGEMKLMKMQPIIKEALKLIRSTIPTTIAIKQHISPACGVIKADPTQIHQIVMNLCTNAYHAMEETGGELKVSLNELELSTLDLISPDMATGVYTCLTVADTGKGMDKKLTQKIFDPFFTTKAIGKGTGLGLSVVHGIVTSMNGALQVYSEPGIGTVFNIYLPAEKSAFTGQITDSKVKIQGGTEQILLVDDEVAIIKMEKQMLERLGYRVDARTSSIEALEVFLSDPDKFDLVITDMAMPHMAGDKLSAELTKIRPDIPVLLCTGFSETMSEETAASIGIKGFLWKPIVMKDLAQKIREVLGKNEIATLE